MGQGHILLGIVRVHACTEYLQNTRGRLQQGHSGRVTRAEIAVKTVCKQRLLSALTFRGFPLTIRKYSPSTLALLSLFTSLQFWGNSPRKHKSEKWCNCLLCSQSTNRTRHTVCTNRPRVRLKREREAGGEKRDEERERVQSVESLPGKHKDLRLMS